MKRNLILLGAALLSAQIAFAQGALDVYKLSQNDMLGTARYMGLGGAMGALGGDITSLAQNPAGIAIYRTSEIVTTMNLSNVNTNTSLNSNRWETVGNPQSENNVNFNMNNLGYVGTFMTGNDDDGLVSFNFGFAYNRVKAYNRTYRSNASGIRSSFTDYIAYKTTGINSDELSGNKDYDPYSNSKLPWLSILSWNSWLMDNFVDDKGVTHKEQYVGLFPNKLTNNELLMRERGNISEYNISGGGNIANMVYFGASIGITDINYQLSSSYEEVFKGVDPTPHYNLNNGLVTRGTGYNFKMGVIVRPVDYLRLGVSVHTPTYYNITDHYDANIAYFNLGKDDKGNPITGNQTTPEHGESSYDLRTPWKFLFSSALIIGQKGLISVDYEMQSMNDMHISIPDWSGNVVENNDIKNYFQTGGMLRVGGEYRLSKQFTLRAGYAHQFSPIKDVVLKGQTVIYSAGTIPHYSLDRGSDYISCGAGYRFGSFYLDGAFVMKLQKDDVYAFSPIVDKGTSTEIVSSLPSSLKTSTSNLVVTLGYKF